MTPRSATGVLERRREMTVLWRSSVFGWTMAMLDVGGSPSEATAREVENGKGESMCKEMLKEESPDLMYDVQSREMIH